jgi:MFS family permease
MPARDRQRARKHPTLPETEAALEETLVELEAIVRLAGAQIFALPAQATPEAVRRTGVDVERNLRAAADRVRALRQWALPDPLRDADRDAERLVREAAERVFRASQAGTPQQLRSAGREADRLLTEAGSRLRQASAAARPALVRQAARLDRALDRGQRHLFRILWFTVPPGSVAWDLHFQALVVSRFLTDVAMQALLYGTLIAVVRRDGDALDAALIGTAYLLPGTVLGLHGGAIADALPKRVALAGAYVAMGLLCFAVPLVLGTGLEALLLILFTVRVLHQISQPSEASAVPLVADSDELASANSLMSLASSAGEVVGKAVLAPVLVLRYGVDPVITLAGVLFILAFTRVFELQPERERQAVRRVRLAAGAGEAMRWLAVERRVLWMLLLAALASTVGVVLGILGPAYVDEVLGVDPSFAMYVFLPAGLGLLVALAAAPWLIGMAGERWVAAGGFALAAAAITGLGLVDGVTRVVGPLLPLDVPGIRRELEVAGLLSLPVGAGITLAAAAAQTYVGRYVPPPIQGRAFALAGVLKDGLAILPLLALGALAHDLGVRAVLAAAPAVLLALALAIDLFAGHFRPPATEPSPGVPG